MIKAWSDEAWEDFEFWAKNDKKTLKKILTLLKDIERNGYSGIGKPEPLKGDYQAIGVEELMSAIVLFIVSKMR